MCLKSSHFSVLFWFLRKFGSVEWIHIRFLLWNHMLVVHHPALAALRFGLFLNRGARHKCPHTRSPPGQHGCVSSHGEHLCCRCVCFNYVVAHVVYGLYLTLKTESNLLTFSLPKPKQCNPTFRKYRNKQSWEGRKHCCTGRCSAALQNLNSPPPSILGLSNTFIFLISPWSSPCFSRGPADVPPSTHPALELSHPARAEAIPHRPAQLNQRPFFFSFFLYNRKHRPSRPWSLIHPPTPGVYFTV